MIRARFIISVPQAMLIQSGMNVASGLINTGLNMWDNAISRDFARESATTAYERQRELLRQMQEYDSPAHQMQMLAAAGINPNLAAGGSIGALPSAPAVAQAVTPNHNPVGVDFGISDIADRMANIERMRSQTSNENAITAATVNDLSASANLKVQDASKVATEINQINANIAYIKSQTSRNEVLTEQDKIRLSNDVIDLSMRSTYVDEEFEAYAADLGLKKNEYDFMVASFALRLQGIEYSNKELLSRYHINEQEASRLSKFNQYADAIYKAQSDSATAEAVISGIDAELLDAYGDADKVISLITSLLDSGSHVVSASRRRKKR